MASKSNVIPLLAVVNAEPRTCYRCKYARFGATTFCTVFSETIIDEASAADDCDVYEPDPTV